MSLSDPIGDMIARIKNSQVRNHKKVDLPSSNLIWPAKPWTFTASESISISLNEDLNKSELRFINESINSPLTFMSKP